MQTQVGKKFWIFFATIVTLSLVSVTINVWGTNGKPTDFFSEIILVAVGVLYFSSHLCNPIVVFGEDHRKSNDCV